VRRQERYHSESHRAPRAENSAKNGQPRDALLIKKQLLLKHEVAFRPTLLFCIFINAVPNQFILLTKNAIIIDSNRATSRITSFSLAGIKFFRA